MSTDRVPLAGVIGSPIAHSKSPLLHAHWLKKLGVPGHYVHLDIAPDRLEEALRFMPTLGFVGANVTIPYKERVLEIADIVSDRATIIGAANTLIFRKDGKIQADNTDGYGFLENMRQNAPWWDANVGPAMVFGAGGAARAIIASLLDAGAPEIFLTNRTKLRANKLRDEFGHRVTVVDWVQANTVLDGVATVVNTTSLGMVGKPPFRVSLDGLNSNATVCDLVYVPLKTEFLTMAEQADCTTVDGLGMLLHQAVPGFERWFGIRPEVDQAAREAILG